MPYIQSVNRTTNLSASLQGWLPVTSIVGFTKRNSMKISTFNDDLIGLRKFANQLERFIKIEHQYVDGGLVIGLSSKFGSGKSTFFQMWKAALQDNQDENKPLVIFLNAWESDYYGDPLFAIISSLVDGLINEGDSNSANKIIDAVKDVSWFSTAIGGQIVKKITGIDPVAAGDLAEKKKKGRDSKDNLFSDSFSIYEGRKKAMHSLKKAIEDFVEKNTLQILFLVDELDRCRPDYAISYLETIKHIFDIKGAVFLLAADRRHLENSAKTAFGPDLDFDEYYRKFIHREVSLPQISDSSYKSIASKYVRYYLEGNGARKCIMALDSSRIDNIVELVGSFKLTPRQIQEIFRMLGHIFDTTEDHEGRLLWCVAVGSILMSVLKLADSKIYNLLGSQQLAPQKALDYFKVQLKDSYADWWFELCLTGGGLKFNENETLETIMKQVGLMNEENAVAASGHLGQWYSGWGHRSSNRFKQIYQKIEHIEQWN